MSNSTLYTQLRKIFGFKTIVTHLEDIQNMVTKAIAAAVPDSTGNYIERALADIEKDESKSSFIRRIGKDQLLGQLLDLFSGGEYAF